MGLAKLVVFASLCYAVSAASVSTNLGYLLMNTNVLPKCFNMISNPTCPQSLVNHQVVGSDANLALVKLGLQAVELQLKAVDFFQDNQTCRDDLREYSCSNTIMKCKTSSETLYGVKLEYDVLKTENACARVKQSCSAGVQGLTIYNCSIIHRDPMEFATCEQYTPFTGDVCPSTNYMYPKLITKFYPFHANGFKAMFSTFSAALKNSTCAQLVLGVYCQILRGSICSADMTKRIYAISRQDCSAVIHDCIVDAFIQTYFLGTCQLLPDATTATRVPLPTVTNTNNAGNNVNSGK